eukprot:UC4_evm2s762
MSENSNYCLRVIFKGDALRNGRLLPLLDSNIDPATLTGAQIITRLYEEERYQNQRFSVSTYVEESETQPGGWQRLDPSNKFDLTKGKKCNLDIELEDTSTWRGAESSNKLTVDRETGYFGIGIWRQKNEANHGTLWRSSYQLGANFLFTIGARFKGSVTDTMGSWKNLPVFSYNDFESFATSAPYACIWVGIEEGGEPLDDFIHPPRAVYILGAEDTGLPKSILKAVHKKVAIPAVRTSSFNVAVAGSIILYDRLISSTMVRLVISIDEPKFGSTIWSKSFQQK